MNGKYANCPCLLTGLVSVKFMPKDSPLIGKGCWTCPVKATEDDHLMEIIICKGITTQQQIERLTRLPIDERLESLQAVWESFKMDIQKTTKKEYVNENHKMRSKIKNLEKDIETNTCTPDLEENEAFREEIAFLMNELSHLQWKIINDQRDVFHVQLAHYGEKPGGIWSIINQAPKPRDLIPRLRIPNTNPPLYKCSSPRMAKLVRTHHTNLQMEGMEDELPKAHKVSH